MMVPKLALLETVVSELIMYDTNYLGLVYLHLSTWERCVFFSAALLEPPSPCHWCQKAISQSSFGGPAPSWAEWIIDHFERSFVLGLKRAVESSEWLEAKVHGIG